MSVSASSQGKRRPLARIRGVLNRNPEVVLGVGLIVAVVDVAVFTAAFGR